MPRLQVRTGRVAAWVALGVGISVGVLTWFGYHAIAEWRRISMQVAAQRASEVADLLREAITRDMQGVQRAVLTSREWNAFATDSPYEVSYLVASAFARYRYPESLFAWKGESDGVVFFNRSERRPPWVLAAPPSETEFPVVIERAPAIASELQSRIRRDASRGRQFSVTELMLGGIAYQVVTQLTYKDPLREHLLDAVGFMVNLNWVKREYFPQLVGEIAQIAGGTESGLRLTISDPEGHSVVGAPVDESTALTSHRSLPLIFFDPLVVDIDPADRLQHARWNVAVNAANDVALAQALNGANRTLAAGGIAILALVVGLLLSARTERTRASLNQLRTDFVSTVTHELKAPIGAVRAAAETMAGGHFTEVAQYRDYSGLVVDQAKRLSRLVENLLAYWRVTDVADAYTFESIDLSEFFEDSLREFRIHLAQAACEWTVEIPEATPPVRADHLALHLLFDNLIDNALRYSGNRCVLRICARHIGHSVIVDIIDRGTGIPPDELPHVTQKFVRGRKVQGAGSGLGLAIATRIARDHRGTIEIQSTVGEGTTVSVKLPAVPQG